MSSDDLAEQTIPECPRPHRSGCPWHFPSPCQTLPASRLPHPGSPGNRAIKKKVMLKRGKKDRRRSGGAGGGGGGGGGGKGGC